MPSFVYMLQNVASVLCEAIETPCSMTSMSISMAQAMSLFPLRDRLRSRIGTAITTFLSGSFTFLMVIPGSESA